jgi:chromosome segregation ATPase
MDSDLGGIVRKMEKLKESVSDEPAKKMVDGLMTAVLQEKAKLSQMTKDLTTSIRKKEMALKNREATVSEELKRTKIDAERSESQHRIKLEKSQRQIDTLTKELEKASKRSQQSPQQQSNNSTQQRELLELKKQADTATKALAMKKQEYDTLKKQFVERDARETELKKTIIKLQNELNSARVGKKSA